MCRVLDILNPTADDVKLLVTMLITGYADQADSHVDRLPEPALRMFAKQTLRVLADVKSADMPQEAL